MINRADKMKKFMFSHWYIPILVSAVVGLFWSTIPLLGISQYALEGAYISCSVEWKLRTTTVMLYNSSIFVFVFIIPVIVILITNLKIIKKVRWAYFYLNIF